MLGERFQHRLTDPPHSVRYELYTLVRIELSHGLEKAFVPDCDELREIEPVALILFHIGDDESQIRRHQPFGRLFVALLGPSGKTTLFFSIGNERQLLDVLQVLIERGRGRGTEIPFGPGLGH